MVRTLALVLGVNATVMAHAGNLYLAVLAGVCLGFYVGSGDER